MNLLGRVAQRHLPATIRKALLVRLFNDTATAFGDAAPPLRGLNAEQTLALFRDFTAQAAVSQNTSPAAFERLFAVTNRYGKWLRSAFGVASTDDAMAVARVVYRAIGIDFVGRATGEIAINRCFFSEVYTPRVCWLMSALDAGLLAGLSNGGRLVFAERITEGHSCCRARLDNAEVVP